MADYEGYPVVVFGRWERVKFAPTVDAKFLTVLERSPVVRKEAGFWGVWVPPMPPMPSK